MADEFDRNNLDAPDDAAPEPDAEAHSDPEPVSTGDPLADITAALDAEENASRMDPAISEQAGPEDEPVPFAPLAPDLEDESAADAAAEPEAELAIATDSSSESQPGDEPDVAPSPDALDAAAPPDAVDASTTSVLPVVPGPADGVESAGLDTKPGSTVHAGTPQIDMGPEKNTGVWAWVLGIIGLIAVIAAGYAIWYYTLSPVQVPNVTGKHLGQAVQALNDSDCRLGRLSYVPTSTAPPGTVLEQDPADGNTVERNTEVALVLAAPPETSAVPDVTGQSSRVAQQTLAREDLGAVIVEAFDNTVPAGNVISQVPAAGSELLPGTLVALAVSKGTAASTVTVPDISHLNADEIKTVLDALQLLSADHRSFDPSITAGAIAAQFPAPGSRVAVRTTIHYMVSDGRPPAGAVEVPDVNSQSEKAATDRLKAAGLKGKIRKAPHASIPAGAVISQLPVPKKRIPKNAEVSLLISSGPERQNEVPSLVETGTVEAEEAVKKAGFNPIMLPSSAANMTPGRVYAQWPAAGTPWTRFYPVIVVYSE